MTIPMHSPCHEDDFKLLPVWKTTLNWSRGGLELPGNGFKCFYWKVHILRMILKLSRSLILA